MMGHLRRLWLFISIMAIDTLVYAFKSRRAWWFTATARTRARFVRTTLGSFWFGFSNLLSILLLGFVYGTVFKVDNFQTYFLYLGLGLVIWNSIKGCISAAPLLFEYNSNNIKNLNLHPIFYSLEEWAFQVQTFAQSFALVFIVLALFNPQIIANFLFFAWLPLINLFIFFYWVPLILCLIGARFTDFSQFVPLFTQLIFLVSPILYQKKMMGALSWLADWNPIYQVLSPVRQSIIDGEIIWNQSILLLIVNVFGCLVSVALLEKTRKKLPFLV